MHDRDRGDRESDGQPNTPCMHDAFTECGRHGLTSLRFLLLPLSLFQLTQQASRELAERDYAHSQLRQELDRCKLQLHRFTATRQMDDDHTELMQSRIGVLQVRHRETDSGPD